MSEPERDKRKSPSSSEKGDPLPPPDPKLTGLVRRKNEGEQPSKSQKSGKEKPKPR